MIHYIAIFEDAGPDFAIGVMFPDLPGCFSAGDSFEEAYKNAQEAIGLWMDDSNLVEPPRARLYSELKDDPAFLQMLTDCEGNGVIVAVPYDASASFQLAAE